MLVCYGMDVFLEFSFFFPFLRLDSVFHLLSTHTSWICFFQPSCPPLFLSLSLPLSLPRSLSLYAVPLATVSKVPIPKGWRRGPVMSCMHNSTPVIHVPFSLPLCLCHTFLYLLPSSSFFLLYYFFLFSFFAGSALVIIGYHGYALHMWTA